ncbi:chromate transporter [Feifania hominis]|uniref:Chromate transporter n=1 Tax=Feifania hominis TaxID=2763660 RepID=A0A926DCI1_9FIRM|nr:chromate transporter [Feifania hominis]MBC8536455.1 chromate transporter [Feifania hominis]
MKTLFSLLTVFFKIGLFSIGGGYAIIPLIQSQVVDQLGWVSQKVFTDIITISQMTPGPLAVNASTFIGIQIAGIPGALIATVGCVVSGICISLALYLLFRRFNRSAYVLQVLSGLKASSLGLILSAAVSLLLLAFGSPVGTLPFDWVAVLVFGGALFALRRWKINPILMMALTGVIGILIY